LPTRVERAALMRERKPEELKQGGTKRGSSKMYFVFSVLRSFFLCMILLEPPT